MAGLHNVAPPCDLGRPPFSYYGEATLPTPIISELDRSACMCIAHCSSRTVLAETNNPFPNCFAANADGCGGVIAGGLHPKGRQAGSAPSPLLLSLHPRRACALVEPELPSVRPSVVGRAHDSPGIKTDAGFHGAAGSSSLHRTNLVPRTKASPVHVGMLWTSQSHRSEINIDCVYLNIFTGYSHEEYREEKHN